MIKETLKKFQRVTTTFTLRHDLFCTKFSFAARIDREMVKLVSYVWGHNVADGTIKPFQKL